MAVHAAKTVVEKLLRDMREAIIQNRFVFVKRSKNMETLASLGLLMRDVREALMTLTFSEYIKGPEIDRDQPISDYFWFFKKRISGQVIYIKLKVEYQTDGKVKVVSFHIDEP